jgi:Mg/Co/Ni transporter MgtE
MSLESRLASDLIRRHPGRAASVLERTGVAEGVHALGRAPTAEAAAVLSRLSPHRAVDILDGLSDEQVARLLEAVPIAVASRLARRLRPARTEAVIDAMGASRARGVRSLIRFPEHSAGALMDPAVLAVPEDLTAREALGRVREAADRARYNVYAIDAEQRLVGVVNLRELFLAKPNTKLQDLMVRNPIALPAIADRIAVVSHPGWKEVHSLPVVDEDGAYLGAVRYRTLRELEELLFRGGRRDADAGAALGDLFAAGASGLLGAMANAPHSGRES